MNETNKKPATDKQKQFIERLASKQNVDVNLSGLSFDEASGLIDDLLKNEKTENGQETKPRGAVRQAQACHPLLKLAIQSVYNRRERSDGSIARSKPFKEQFIKEVLGTYEVFLEIEHAVAASSQPAGQTVEYMEVR